eukprot:NODE_3401_length_984_cov_12.576471_g3123_i0.p1 GENE.NODE_3401_length_984_cov_12.576471_g3123_i0~~NODE_3401_length_984_cov_12.576471_g3123_i0.p1  ORF type:complete len:243 (+),score=20.41 NODE_3401_length_984_cov_12.576471_g3123_i0:58-786(+)
MPMMIMSADPYDCCYSFPSERPLRDVPVRMVSSQLPQVTAVVYSEPYYPSDEHSPDDLLPIVIVWDDDVAEEDPLFIPDPSCGRWWMEERVLHYPAFHDQRSLWIRPPSPRWQRFPRTPDRCFTPPARWETAPSAPSPPPKTVRSPSKYSIVATSSDTDSARRVNQELGAFRMVETEHPNELLHAALRHVKATHTIPQGTVITEREVPAQRESVTRDRRHSSSSSGHRRQRSRLRADAGHSA